MILHAGVFLLCLLWMLLCWRFYSVISSENIWQRRAIAIAAGLGAGLIYLLGSMLMPWLQAWVEEPKAPKEPEGIRIQMK